MTNFVIGINKEHAMSLDLYIISPEPVVKRGTGVFIRRNGQNFELKTLEEVKQCFPNSDLSRISVYEYADEYYWHGNITHNMNEMARHVPIEGSDQTLYDLLWRPEEQGFLAAGSRGYREAVLKGYLYLRGHSENLAQFNPDNGWGDYDLLLSFTEDFLLHLIKAGDEFPVEASR